MILKNKRDNESWIREKTIETMKANPYIELNDIICVAGKDFYQAVSSSTSIPLQNSLYAQIINSEITGNISTASKLKTARNIALTGDVTGNANFDGSKNISITTTVGNDSHSHSNSTITSLDASKITSGTIDIARLPKGALERLVRVQDDSARFALTTSNVQLGDTVLVTNTNKMYLVIDESQLNREAGYQVYTAGSATEVPWSGVTGKPSTMPNPQALTISLNGTSQGAYTGSSAKSINITPSSIGAAASSHGTHVTYATIAAKAPGTASIGTSSKVAREDHVHPVQTTISGNSGTSSKWATARTITLSGDVTGSVSIDGSSDVTLTTTVGNDSHSHSWTNITSKPSSFTPSAHNQSSNTITAMTGYTKASSASAIAAGDSLNTAIGKIEKALDGKQPSGSYALSNHNHDSVYAPISHGTHVTYATVAGKAAGTAAVGTSSKVAREDHVHPLQTTVSGNAGTATTLQTARTINGTSFNGSANITTSNWGTTRTLTIGNGAKSVNGAANVSWSLSEIGAFPAAGGTITGNISYGTNGATKSTIYTSVRSGSWFSGAGNNASGLTINTPASGSTAHPVITQLVDGVKKSSIEFLNDGTTVNIYVGGSTSNIMTLSPSGLKASKVYNAVWNDYAEFFERGEDTEPGDIISLDYSSNEEKYIKASKENNCVVGVHSDSFAHLIGGENPPANEDYFEYNIKKFIPVGLAGRVKCKVVGPVKKGDIIVLSDIKGVGISEINGFDNYSKIGYALEDKKNQEIGLVKILIK